MATDVERLVVALEARTKAFENALSRANSTANKQARAIEQRFATLNQNLATDLVGIGRGVVGVLAGGAVTRGLLRLSESATRIDNSLKVAGLSGAELERVYQGLAKAAQQNGAPIETLAALYGKAAQAQKELGVSTEELLGFTNNVALALRVAGTDAQTASGALLQLGQALGSGKVQAEEFNSILEGAPTIAQAVAAGLKEAGGSVSQLKALVVDGQISSEAFFRAFEAGAVILEEKAASSTFTVAQASTNLYNALTDVVREFNSATGAGENFALGVNNAANAINDFDVSGLIQKIKDAEASFRGFLGSLGNAQIIADLNNLLGVTDADGNVFNLDKEQAEENVASLERDVQTLQQRIALNTSLGFDNADAIAQLNQVQAKLAEVRAAAAGMPDFVGGYRIGESGLEAIPAGGSANFQVPFSPLTGVPADLRTSNVKPVSLKNFKAPAGGGGGGGGRRKGRGGGGGGENDFQRETEQIKERTAAIQAETAALAQVNPLVEDYGYSVEFARSKQDLLTAAQKAGIAITPELEAQITALATGYADASASADRLAASQDQARETADFLGDSAFDAFSDLIPQIETGNKALDKFLNTLIDAVAQAWLLGKGPLAGLGGGGGGGLFGGLFKIFGFAKGGIAAGGQPLKTFAKGGVSRTAAIFGEGPMAEAAVPLPDGRRIPVDLRMPAKAERAGGSTYAPVYNIDARGADQAAVVRLERSLAERDRTESKRVAGYEHTRSTRSTRP